MKRIIGGTVLLAAAAALLILTPLTTASAGSTTVSATPAANMPYITSTNSTVRQLVQCGSTMYAVGSFSSVGAPGKSSMTRHNAFSFNATTGAISSWNPNPNGMVDSIALSSDCKTAYLGGGFTTVGSTSVARLAKVNTTTGAAISGFAPAPTGEVFTLKLIGSRLFVGGGFSHIDNVGRVAFATISPTNGALDNYVSLGITGTLPNSTTKIYNFSLSPNGKKLLAMGSFLMVGGKARQQIFMLDLGTSSTTVDTWNSPYFSESCTSDEPLWDKAAAWSPEGGSIYIATTGYHGTSPLCDATSKFAATATFTLKPVWINKTGCDSLYAVIADDYNVYVGGHQRWLGNPNGCDAAGPGAYSRPGIGGLVPGTGAVTSWNPTRDRGEGADDLLLTSAGLWVASDTYDSSTKCGGTYHPGICFFPK
jgi:hypothetical protein